MTAERRQEIAKTILAQLGGNMFRAMTGAKDFSVTEAGLMFRLPNARAAKGVKIVQILLTPSDTYIVKFYGTKGNCLKITDGVYWDTLRSVFREQTGLRASL